MTRVKLIAAISSAMVCVSIVLIAVTSQVPVPSFDRAADVSRLVLAADRQVLRAYLASDGRWRFAVEPEEVSKSYLDALLAYEDRRFYHHSGVDFLAMGRIAWNLARHGRAISGGSTLTMQVVRLLGPGMPGLRGKFVQVLRALRLEQALSKREILKLYLMLAPFGGNIEGVRAASLFYFGKEPKYLSVEEGALLVAIAQSPTRRRPERSLLAAVEGRDRVLARLPGRCFSSGECVTPAPIKLAISSRRLLAPHFADRVRKLSSKAEILTTVDATLQARLEDVVREALKTWPADVNAAVLVVRNSDSSVLAYIGASDFFGTENSGQFDHVQAFRSPGSALKPMIYGLGFEALVIHPSTIIADKPVNFSGYAPQNFNEDYQGEMTVRDALIKSINTTAVGVLARITPSVLLTRLRSVDIPIRVSDTDASAGLAVALGGGGITLQDLTRIFAGISNQGRVRPLRMLAEEAVTASRKLLDENAAWAVADILGDMPPPPGFARRQIKGEGRRIAYKTGTSFGYRDAWAVGFDHDHTVGVWLGRSDGTPNPGALGLTAAAPILYRSFDLLPTPQSDVTGSPRPDNVFAIRVPPPRLSRFPNGLDAQKDHLLRIIFPGNRASIVVQRDGDGAGFVPLIADGGEPPYFWFVDGTLLPDADAKIRWHPAKLGPVSATLMDSRGAIAEVEFSTE